MKRVTITAELAGERLDKVVVSALGVGRAAAKDLIERGAVRVVREGGDEARARRAKKGDVAEIGSVVLVDESEGQQKASETFPEPDASVAFEVRLERADLVVVEKPAGVPSAPLRGGELGTLANGLAARFPETRELSHEGGLVHRLDTGTSGLLVAARTAAAFEALRARMQAGRIQKRYLLVCAAADLPEVGTIDLPLASDPKNAKRVLPVVGGRVRTLGPGRPAVTEWRLVRVSGGRALVEARVAKATRHQIRAHFAAIEHPLAGDELYGGERVEGLGRHALHAAGIDWEGDRVVRAFSVESPLPSDLQALVAAPW